ncbi:MAG: RNA polymerase sigma factor [Planctomycetaceae bacterium]|nr:RNA polymerase sigma factor [Planctomycetaceae bacterium]
MTAQSVFLEHERWLRTVVRSRISEPDAVEDIMQNIALAIVRQRDVLSEINRIGAWLYQIAVRQVLMYRRTTGRRRRLHDRIAAESSEQSVDSARPLQQLLAQESAECVQDALEKLPEIDRQILLLKYLEGWSYRQLSEYLGVKEDTIEYRLLKARRQLRRLLLSLEEKDHGTHTA